MKKMILVLAGLVFVSASNCSSKSNFEEGNEGKTNIVTVVFYNVENLFDIYDDPRTNDNEFLPTSGKEWNEEKYNTKLDHLSQVISGLEVEAEDEADIIGLVEIENKKVLEDLIETKGLNDTSFEIIHGNSPDDRGIDVAMLYNKKTFKYEGHEYLRVQFDDPDIKTRDILYVNGKINGEKIHVFVNHWPSRRDGAEVTEYKRLNAANVLRDKIDDIQNADPESNIIVMGDFNDYPDNKSIREVVKADNTNAQGHFFNTAAKTHELAERGSYNFRGKWVTLDQIMLSNYLMNTNQKFQLQEQDIEIFKREWMMFRHPKYKDLRPSRTYGGDKYFGGYSDHLPVYIQLICN